MSDDQRTPAMDYASRSSRHRPQRFATMAVVVGVIGLLVPLLGVIAIQLGIVARREAKQHSQLVLRRANVGLGCGIVSVAGWLLLVLFLAQEYLAFWR